MRGLALCLAAAVMAVAGCGSDDNSSSAPNQEKVTASGATGAPAAVSAKGRATPASLCKSEGKGKPKRQCVAGLKKLDKGKAANPKAACKGMSKKKTKGVRGKSPFAVCVSAAAKLLAGKSSKGRSGNGAADGQTGSLGSGTATATDDDDDSSSTGADEPDPVCVDAKGKVVPFDSEDVEECEPGTSASDSSSDDDSAADESSDDPSDDDE